MNDEIVAIQQRLDRVTKGKFEIDPFNAGAILVEDDDGYIRALRVYRTVPLLGQEKCDEQFSNDLEFYLNVRDDMKRLLDEIEYLNTKLSAGVSIKYDDYECAAANRRQ